ncbi:SDR family NAD(P)-dependent oxidoreductase [Novosphingobium album (ex Liu et al. 2023)]|uniref:SDR family oxidoreductase n=1 Tax=Novosphingobium album (ex Liu et al. 2023) TaxID=3031130 RepID=A0ABT5WUI0_9SPHN|nr:SDR family NAD(P)-dependent oxidoreductase [Novosphingobium album (ex Liu et al. 2023)]MDE8653526.1 SDR family oxidoreductase [Novosphingobium album (ex Liu et al. 2023)]
MSEWQGRTAVVTGGGRGFGKAFGTALAMEGAHAVLVDIDGSEAEAAAEEIRAAGGWALGLAGDVTDEARMAEVMARAADAQGGIDLLINNAGLHSDEYGQPITKLGLAKMRRLFDVNVMGVVCCTLAAAPHMQGRAGASIVNISSSAAHMGGSPYGDSKLAVAGLTITFARELGPLGIRVNAISPGLMLTETIRNELPPATMARVKAMQLIDGDGAEEDIVEAMLYLASRRARFVTGEVLRVTGGMAAGV